MRYAVKASLVALTYAALAALGAAMLPGRTAETVPDCAALWRAYEATGDRTAVERESCYAEDLHG